MRLMLAPMEGVIDHTMRDLLTSLGGLDRCVTEFVRISDLLLPPRVFHRYCPELKQAGRTPSGTPVYLQLLGGQATPMAENAARAAELGAPGIDLNFGCPAKTVNRSDGGAILLREPERVHKIVAAVRRAVPTDIPVTVKIRLGYQDRELLEENIGAIAAARANELTIHARTKVDGYRPPAYWEDVARARQWTTMPIVANGEIWNPADASRCRQVSGCANLMLGRGILCRPDLALLIKADAQGSELEPLAWPQVQSLLLKLFEQIVDNYDDKYVGNPIKQWLAYQRSYFPQAALLFERIKRLRAPVEIRQALLDQPPSLAERARVA
ncbi:MAG: tRNA-dihydrouridine synthase [Gammaproteobacteria bacterium]|nr:tRNA-dihydrouridine synthase [Gammaproteobacteria bacterium]